MAMCQKFNVYTSIDKEESVNLGSIGWSKWIFIFAHNF